jgi:hypothetical protein
MRCVLQQADLIMVPRDWEYLLLNGPAEKVLLPISAEDGSRTGFQNIAHR